MNVVEFVPLDTQADFIRPMRLAWMAKLQSHIQWLLFCVLAYLCASSYLSFDGSAPPSPNSQSLSMYYMLQRSSPVDLTIDASTRLLCHLNACPLFRISYLHALNSDRRYCSLRFSVVITSIHFIWCFPIASRTARIIFISYVHVPVSLCWRI